MTKKELTEAAERDAAIKRTVYEYLRRLGYSPGQVEDRRREDRRFRPIRRASFERDGQIGEAAWEQIPAPDVTRAFDLWDAISSLDSKTKAMIHLWRMGCTHAEVAESLHLSPDTVTRDYDRIRRLLSGIVG